MLSNIPDSLPPHFKNVYQSYEPYFDAMSLLPIDFIAGDAGTSTLFAFHKKQLVDICSYMGSSPGMALGAQIAGAKNVWSVTGDFSFLAAGILGLNEIIGRNAPVKILIFNNKIAAATGGQPVPQVLIDTFIRGHREMITFLDSTMSKETTLQILEKMNATHFPQIGIVNIN